VPRASARGQRKRIKKGFSQITKCHFFLIALAKAERKMTELKPWHLIRHYFYSIAEKFKSCRETDFISLRLFFCDTKVNFQKYFGATWQRFILAMAST
jgi:hypothetical protein